MLEDALERVLAARDTPEAREALGRLSSKLTPGAGALAATQDPQRGGELARDTGDFDVARELFNTSYYLRQWGRVAMRDRFEEVDDFGYDARYEARWRPLFDFLYDRWWRVDVEGIENVPSTGPVALVANHSGALPWDGVMLAAALRKEHPAKRQVRWLAEDFIFHFPFLGAYSNRLGAVRACQENAERLLRSGACVGVFPEGVKGLAKLYAERYRLQRFGRGGHIKLALRTGTPLVPVTIVGAEEASPNVLPSGFLARLLGVPYVPLTPTFPWLGPLGLLPAPSKWTIHFGEPLVLDEPPSAADDEVLVGRLNERLRSTIQGTLDRCVAKRRSIWRG
ncbi:MAG: acyltransferase family protein [Deltaproteobacteria bacterium]|nr:acyltransferase family protein [Deltaproteobacteria bacterium]